MNVIENMEKSIIKNDKGEDVVPNPVNPEENFADKWPTHPKRRENFYKWLAAVKKDVHEILDGANRIQIQNTMNRVFGKDLITKASSLLVERRKSNRSRTINQYGKSNCKYSWKNCKYSKYVLWGIKQ